MVIVLEDCDFDMSENMKLKIEVKGSLTFPRVVLQMYLKGKKPSTALTNEALQCIDDITKNLMK